MYTDILISNDEVDSGIIKVQLNRPQKLNSIGPGTLMELRRIFEHDLPARIHSVKAVVLSSTSPKSFSTGLDLANPAVISLLSASTGSPGRRADELRSIIAEYQAPILAIANFPRPVICAISGYCYGLGVDIASACDVRVASPQSSFSVREVTIGICADLGSLYFLPRICNNDSWVREICLTGRTFKGAEALSNGLVSELCDDPSDRALSLARFIAGNETVAIHGTKENLNFGSRKGMREAFEFVAVWNSVKLQDTEAIQKAISQSFKKVNAKL